MFSNSFMIFFRFANKIKGLSTFNLRFKLNQVHLQDFALDLSVNSRQRSSTVIAEKKTKQPHISVACTPTEHNI